MKSGPLGLTSSLKVPRPAEIAGRLRNAGWPTLAGLLAAGIGLAVLTSAWHYHQEARFLQTRASDSRTGQGDTPTGGRQFARATEASFTIPEDSTHLDDLNRLFKLAKAKGIQIGAVEYRQTSNPSLQVMVRTMDIRIQDDYPKLKGYVAELLGSMPHVALQEIRVERKDAAITQGQTLLKLVFVYRTPDASLQRPRSVP